MEACEVFTRCSDQFWDGLVTAEVCLKPDFAPVPVCQDDYQSLIMSFLDINGNDLLLSSVLGKKGSSSSDGNFLGRRCLWLGQEINGQAWRVCQLQEHDAMRLCLQRGMRVEDKRAQVKAGKGWLFAETAKAAEDHEAKGATAPQAHLFMPLHGRDGCIGLLHLTSGCAEEFTEAKQESFAPLAEAMGMQLSALRLHVLLERERQRQQALANDYRSMLENMLPPHVVDQLTKARGCGGAEPSRECTPTAWDDRLFRSRSRSDDLPYSGGGSASATPTGSLSPSPTADTLPSPSRVRGAWAGTETLQLHRRSSKKRLSSSKLVQRLDKLAYAEYHDCVAILFTDIKGFTSLSERLEPEGVMVMLDDLFARFDDIISAAGSVAYKVETIGDAYMVAFGLFEDEPDEHKAAVSAVRVASSMVQAARRVHVTFEDGSEEPVQIRAGIALGQIMSGIIGKKMPRYCMFGDTVNTASRMESTGVAGMVHITESIRDACLGSPEGKSLDFQDSGGREVKGKGFMKTYLLEPDQVLSLEHHRSEKAIV